MYIKGLHLIPIFLVMNLRLCTCKPSLKVPSAGNCKEDTVLTCQVTGDLEFTGWFGLNRDIMSNGNPVRAEDNNKYTETREQSSFTLTIHNTDKTDAGNYKCINGFGESVLKHLDFECKASSNYTEHKVSSGKKIQIIVDKLFPASPNLTVTFSRQNSAIQISGSKTCSGSTLYSGYYRCVWSSSNSIDDGLYTYSVVVTTITEASPLAGSFKIVSPRSPSISNTVHLNASHEALYGNEGQSLTIQCTSSGGYPVPTVTWYKESISVSNQLATSSDGMLQSNGTFTVNLQHTFSPVVSGDDRKNLICRSYYPQADSAHIGSSSKSVLLYLNLKPSRPTVTQTSVVLAGNDVGIRCRTTGCRPPASISWLYRDVRYNGSTTSSLDSATETFTVISTLTRQVTATDNGQSIQCIVTHPALVSLPGLTKSIELDIHFGPSAAQITGNNEIIASGSNPLTLTCTAASSNPASDIIWKSGLDILHSDRSYENSSGKNNGVVISQQLVLHPTRYMDGDEIKCSVSNTVSQSPVEDKVKLNLKYRPLINPMSDVTVVEGNYSILECSAISKPVSKFKWYRNDHGSNVLDQGTGTLNSNRLIYRIDIVRRSDADTYTCNADNKIEKADNKNVILKVYYPPNVTATTANTTVKAASATITCNANGVPKNNYTYGKWMQKWPGHSILLSEKPGSETLTLTNLTYQHSGVYTCSASNGIKVFDTNKEFMEGSVQLTVKSFPIITSMTEKTSARLKENATIDVYYFSNAAGSNVTIYRNVNGSRKDEVKYSVSETTVQVDLKVFTQTVKTGGVKAQIFVTIPAKEDIGFYDVIVSNEINSTVRSVEIVVKGPPSLPSNLTVDNINYNEARLSWSRGYHGGYPQTFVIQLSTDQVSWKDVNVFDGKNESEEMISEVLTGLSPSTTYFMRMYSSNKEGNSSLTDILNYTTSSKIDTSGPNMSAIIGGAAGGTSAVLIIVVVIFLVRRGTFTKCKPEERGRKSDRKPVYVDEDDYGMRDNPMYVSAGPRDQAAAGSGKSNVEVEYSTVDKKNTPVIGNQNDVYAEVDKLKKKKNNNEKKDKKDKKGLVKDKKRKKVVQDGDLYVNATELIDTKQSKNEETIYENPEPSMQPAKKNASKDGLIYADLAFNDQPKGQKKLVIHGLDSMTEYVEVDFTKKVDPLPDSDDENVPPK